MNVEEFIKQHEYHNYCEAIIATDGDIHYAVAGHTNDLIRITGKSKDSLNIMMPMNASPLHWMVCYTGCIPVWYEFFIYNSMTREQMNTIQMLVNHGVLANGVVGNYTDELERCELLKKLYNDEIEAYEIPEKLPHIQIWRKE